MLAAWEPALGDTPRQSFIANRRRWLNAAAALLERHPRERLDAALDYMVTDEILGSEALTMPGFAKVADKLLARAHARRTRTTTRQPPTPGTTPGLGWPDAKVLLERAIPRHGRDGRKAGARRARDAQPAVRGVRGAGAVGRRCASSRCATASALRQLWDSLLAHAQPPPQHGSGGMTADEHQRPATPSAAALPPHNLEAEKSVLGAVLLDERHLASVVVDEQLRAEHFYRDAHASVFSAMLAAPGRRPADRPPDRLRESSATAGSSMSSAAPGAVEELAGWVPATGHARDYGRIVRDTAQMRALHARDLRDPGAHRANAATRGEALLDEAERIIFALRADDLRGHARMLEHAVAEELDRLEQAARDERALPGLAERDRRISTGCSAGCRTGGCTCSPARPAMGKSLLALQIARHVAAHASSSASCSPASR